MKLGDKVYVVVKHSRWMASVIEGTVTACVDNKVVWFDHSGLSAVSAIEDVFVTEDAAKKRKDEVTMS